MKLSDGFTELTQEEQEALAGGGLLCGLFRCIGNILGFRSPVKIKEVTKVIINCIPTVPCVPPEVMPEQPCQ